MWRAEGYVVNENNHKGCVHGTAAEVVNTVE